MPFLKKSKASSQKTVQLGSTASQVTLVNPTANLESAKVAPTYTKSTHPKQKLLSSEKDNWNTWEARLVYITNK